MPMSRVITKEPPTDDSDEDYLLNGKNDANNDGGISEKNSGKPTEKYTITVVDVAVNNTKSNHLVYFNCVELGNDSGKYRTITYNLSTVHGTLGIFDLLDDYFLHRYKFFHSSKSVQAFMVALVQAERKFRDKTGFSLIEYCSDVTEHSLGETMRNVRFKNGNNSKLWNGYEIRDEATYLLDCKRKYIDIALIEELGKDVVSNFVKNMKYVNTKHFCGICVNTTDDIPPSLFTDPFIDLPMIVYMPEFTEILVTKLAYSFLTTKEFQEAGMDTMKFEIFILMPEATLKDLSKIVKKDNELKDYYALEDYDFIIGKYKSYAIREDDIDSNEFDSIICYS